MKNDDGETPFSAGCRRGQVTVVEVMLKDPRVDITPDDIDGRTPLWWASRNGHHEILERLIARSSDLGDIENKKGKMIGKDYTALEIARRERHTEVVSLLERFMANHAHTRHELRMKLGMLDALTAEVFALTGFLCDDLLQLKPASDSAAQASSTVVSRFFAIASKLPMELQMLLCHRVFGSMRQNILRQDSEAAFKSLARTLFLLERLIFVEINSFSLP